MPSMSSKALSIALRGRPSTLQATGCVYGASRRCGEQKRLLTIGKRLQATNMSRPRAEGTRRLLRKEDRAAGFGTRGIHTGKEVEEIGGKGAEEKGAEEKGAEENGAGEEHNNATIRRVWRLHKPEPPHHPPHADLLAAITGPPTLPYAIGTDLCHIPRIHRILSVQQQLLGSDSGTGAPKFWLRVFTPVELSFNGWRRLAGDVQRRSEFFAGRWAAKEAIIKAWAAAYPSRPKLFMHDIVVLSPKQCKATAPAESAAAEEAPVVVGRAAADADTEDPESSTQTSGPPRAFVRVPGGEAWKEVSVSISHDGDFASAVALVTIDSMVTIESIATLDSMATPDPIAPRRVRYGDSTARRVFSNDSPATRRMVFKALHVKPEKPIIRTLELGEGKE